MIPVPNEILAGLAEKMGFFPDGLVKFSGGREDSDGVIYRILQSEPARLLKVMSFPIATHEKDIFRFTQRLHFLRFAGQHGVRVAYPLLSPQGNLFEMLMESQNCYAAYCMHQAPGKVIRENEWDERFIHSWGAVIGDMHRLAREYPVWNGVDTPAGEHTFSWLEEWNSFNGWITDAQVREKWLSLRNRLETLPIRREVYGFTHNDPHHHNLLYDSEHMTLLDFDVANCHWFVNDLAIAGQGILFSPAGGLARPVKDTNGVHTFYRALLAGYREKNDLPVEWLQYLDWFIAYRRILLFTVMQGWLKSQPEVCQSWKQMIMDEPEVVGNDPFCLVKRPKKSQEAAV